MHSDGRTFMVIPLVPIRPWAYTLDHGVLVSPGLPIDFLPVAGSDLQPVFRSPEPTPHGATARHRVRRPPVLPHRLSLLNASLPSIFGV